MFNRMYQTHSAKSPRGSRKVGLERLEKRELMAVSIFQSGREIRIEGDQYGIPSADHVVVRRVDSQLQVTQAFPSGYQLTHAFDAATVDRIYFRGGEMDDIFENYSNTPSLAYGDNGNDRLVGGTGVDELNGGDGHDTIIDYGGGTATFESDLLYGIVGNRNKLVGGKGHDTLIAYGTANYLRGDTGDDAMYGGPGADLMVGGWGNDYMFGSAGNDFMYGFEIDWRSRSAYEWFEPGTFDSDMMIGGVGTDKLEGGPDRDHLDGGHYYMPDGARDVLVGGTGEDSFVTHHRQVKIGDRYYIQPYMEDEQQDFNFQYELYDDRFNHYDPRWRDRWVVIIV